MKDFIFGVQVYDKMTKVTFYQCFYSSRDVAKQHCEVLNSCFKRTRFYKVKKIRLFNELVGR